MGRGGPEADAGGGRILGAVTGLAFGFFNTDEAKMIFGLHGAWRRGWRVSLSFHFVAVVELLYKKEFIGAARLRVIQ
jgi:hypothetical protein